jgi:hypothetical protein
MTNQDYGAGGGVGQVSSSPAPPPNQRRGGIGIGIVLVAVGVAFLVGQFIPGITWWQMWPLVVLLVGGIQIVTPDPKDGWGISRIMDGVGTVIVGLVLLGNTTGHISWNVWWTLLTLWPVLLVAIGLRIIGRAIGQSWVSALAPVVIWLAIAYAVATALTNTGGAEPLRPLVGAPGEAFDTSEPLGGVTRANLTLNGGAGDISIVATSHVLVSARGRSPFGTPEFVVKRTGGDADVRFGLGERKNAVVGPGFTAGSVELGLSDSVLWNAVVQTGASSLSADLSNVELAGLTLRTGASSVNLRLGEVPARITKDKVSVKAGASSVDITVPRDAAVRIVAENGLSSTNVSDGFKRQGDGSWQTPGYGSAQHAYEIGIESGVGSVSVKQD